jgi:hypothetical protein
MVALAALAACLASTRAQAQVIDSATYVVRRGADTIVVEHTTRGPIVVKGDLVVRGAMGHEESWSVVLADDGTMPLVEVMELDSAVTGTQKAGASRRSRFIFKGDSVAVDDLTKKGMFTRIFPTKVSAVPYRNLSFGLLEPVVQHAVGKGAAGGDVPFFNLGGGQTAVGTIRRTAADHATVTIGSVVIELTLDDQSRIVAAAIPAQGVLVDRH